MMRLLRAKGLLLLPVMLSWFVALSGCAADFKITFYNRTNENENLGWTNVFTDAITTVEQSGAINGSWTPVHSYWDKGNVDSASFPAGTGKAFFRLLQVDISATSGGYTNLVNSYGIITTMAGNGAGGTDGINYWTQSMEGGYATNAALSRPHIATSDAEGNVYIADRDSHSILKVTCDARIHTVAGTHVAGFSGDGPLIATNSLLNQPNGLDVKSTGLFFILDSGNNKVRKVDTNGIMTTLFTIPAAMISGRGLWVKKDESIAYFCAGTQLGRWTPTNGVTAVNTTFTDLGNLDLDSTSHVFVADRGANRIYRIANTGSKTAVAGNGAKTGGGDGATALATGLSGVRGIWFLPNGGYLLGTHEGCQLWYVDSAGLIHLLIDGATAAHAGDGEWFHSPILKISQVRQVTMMDNGDLLICENDVGYVRRVSFGRLQP